MFKLYKTKTKTKQTTPSQILRATLPTFSSRAFDSGEVDKQNLASAGSGRPLSSGLTDSFLGHSPEI